MSNQKKGNLTNSDALPVIPDKLYFAIGEVAKLCQLQPHVIRYWEQEFSQLSPSKRRGNRRYYQRKDVLLVRRIRSLLYEQGFTIAGARQKLAGDKESGSSAVSNSSAGQQTLYALMQRTLSGLEDVLGELQSA